MLQRGIHLHRRQFSASKRGNVEVFFKAFLPKSLCRSNVAGVAPCARVFVNNAWHERFWDFILEGEAWRKSCWGFEDDFEFRKWKEFSKSTNQLIFRSERHGAKERKHDHEFFFRNCGDGGPFLVNFVEEGVNAAINKLARILVLSENLLQLFNFFVKWIERRWDGVGKVQKSWEQSSFVCYRDERVKVCINSRKCNFPVDCGRRLVCVTINVYIQEWKDIVIFFLICELNVGMFRRQILTQHGDVLLWAKKNKNVINVTGEEYRHVR